MWVATDTDEEALQKLAASVDREHLLTHRTDKATTTNFAELTRDRFGNVDMP